MVLESMAMYDITCGTYIYWAVNGYCSTLKSIPTPSTIHLERWYEVLLKFVNWFQVRNKQRANIPSTLGVIFRVFSEKDA
jgi:hypothetical protein